MAANVDNRVNMKITLGWATLLAIAAVQIAPAMSAQDRKPLSVFVMAGQSNMVGKPGDAARLPEALRSAQEGVLYFDATTDSWIPLEPGKTDGEEFGPELTFGIRMAEQLGTTVGIVKHAKGGTSLGKDWDPKDRNGLYAALAAKVGAAKKACGKDYQMRVVGMVWMQGERDATEEKLARDYGSNLVQLIRSARKDFGNDDLVFVAGRVNPPLEAYPAVDLVRKAQESCKLEGYAFVDCDDLAKNSDGLHFSSVGIQELGRRLADKAFGILDKDSKNSEQIEAPLLSVGSQWNDKGTTWTVDEREGPIVVISRDSVQGAGKVAITLRVAGKKLTVEKVEHVNTPIKVDNRSVTGDGEIDGKRLQFHFDAELFDHARPKEGWKKWEGTIDARLELSKDKKVSEQIEAPQLSVGSRWKDKGTTWTVDEREGPIVVISRDSVQGAGKVAITLRVAGKRLTVEKVEHVNTPVKVDNRAVTGGGEIDGKRLQFHFDAELFDHARPKEGWKKWEGTIDARLEE